MQWRHFRILPRPIIYSWIPEYTAEASVHFRKWRYQTRSTRGQSRGVAQVGKKLVEWSLSIWSEVWRKNMLHGSVSPKGACTICLWNGCNFMVNVLYFVCFIYSGISLIREEEEHWTANSKSIKIAENTTSQAKRRQFTEGTCTYLAIHRFRWSKRNIQYTNYIAYINSSRVSPVGTPKIILGITGSSENLGRDDGIEEP